MVRSLSCAIVAVIDESREVILATNDTPPFLQVVKTKERLDSHPRVTTGGEEHSPRRSSGSLSGQER